MILKKLQIETDDTSSSGQSQGYLEALSQFDAKGTFTSKLIHSQKNKAFDLILTKEEIEKLCIVEQSTVDDDEYCSKICYDQSKFKKNLDDTFVSETPRTSSWFSFSNNEETKITKLVWMKKSKLAQSGI